ncbi:MAG: response regulator [Planctomycetota bacterium]|nr:response regulator [Planctomycetota bacterium]
MSQTKILQGRRLLIADDEEAFVKMISLFLRQAGAEVLVARDGAEAFHLANLNPVDAIIMDLQMPGTNGMEAIRSLRLISSRSLIVVLTGFPTEEVFAEAREAGADMCVAKPAAMSQLIADLAAALQQREAKEKENA